MYIFCLIIFILKVFINIDLIRKTVKEIRFWILLSKVKLFENLIFKIPRTSNFSGKTSAINPLACCSVIFFFSSFLHHCDYCLLTTECRMVSHRSANRRPSCSTSVVATGTNVAVFNNTICRAENGSGSVEPTD